MMAHMDPNQSRFRRPGWPLLALAVGLMGAGCTAHEPPPGPNPVVQLSGEVTQLNRLTTDLASATERQRTVASDLTQRMATLEKEVHHLRGQLDEAHHANKQLVEQVASLEERRFTPPQQPQAAMPAEDPLADDGMAFMDTIANNVDPRTVPSRLGPSLNGNESDGEPTTIATGGAQKLDTSLTGPNISKLAALTTNPPPEGKSPEDVYNAAFLRLKGGQYEEALEGFKGFLQWFPEDPLADNAQYWVGEVYYVQRHFPEALMAFNQVLVRWPSSDKVPASLLKIGFSFYELEDLRNAQSSLQRLIRDYPDSPAVTMARQRLRVIEGEMG